MMHKIARPLPQSLTLTIAGRVQKLVAEGTKVFRFNIGEPDFPTPDNIKEAGYEAIRANRTTYTAGAGIPQLREAIAAELRNRYGLHYDWKEIVVTIGGKFALAASILATIEPGDEVIIPSPYFLSYPDMVTIAGGKPVFMPLSPDNGFVPRPEDVERCLTTGTRMLILNSPHNPTGVVTPPEALATLLEYLKDRDILILSDEVYDRLLFDGARHTSPAQASGYRDRVLLVNSFSKTYCMTGWRLGYLVAPEPLAEAVAHLQSHMTSSPNAIAQWAALEALQGPQESVDAMLATFQSRRDLICTLLDSIPELPYSRPTSTFYVFPDVSSYLGRTCQNTMELSMRLLDEYHVATVPGSVFGNDRHIRLSYATSEEEIREGIARLAEGLSSLR